MSILVLTILCVAVISSSALIIPRVNKTNTPDPSTHHTDPNHMDQVAVDSKQARTVFRELTLGNTFLKMQDLERFLNSSDTNGDGQVTSDEFLQTWFQHKVGSLVNAVQFFFNIDINKDNRITDDVDLKYIFGIFDRNDDGVVDEAEFVVQWVKLSSL
ncbi:uncharacterized protein LOC124275145 [Haliotis rubra]|uniref:uncharacterized protein LOC124275145 n=1 Tax=Haliotis rubra TaxID=36100 RepID=UPI001EE5E28F|nr:uncharacterized protein LOC124275145 [Haliotis rubra]